MRPHDSGTGRKAIEINHRIPYIRLPETIQPELGVGNYPVTVSLLQHLHGLRVVCRHKESRLLGLGVQPLYQELVRTGTVNRPMGTGQWQKIILYFRSKVILQQSPAVWLL